MNSARLKSSRSYYHHKDTYAVPQVLKEARSQLDKRVLPPQVPNLPKKPEPQVPDEDETFINEVTNKCGIFHLAFRRLVTPIFKRVSLVRILPTLILGDENTVLPREERNLEIDVESNVILKRSSLELQQLQLEQDLRALRREAAGIGPMEEDEEEEMPGLKSYEVTTEMGERVDVMEIDVPHKKRAFEDFLAANEDYRSLVLSQNCTNLIWLWSERTRIILITDNDARNGTWSLKEWYRKILSDMALTDSVLIGHPYYWHPVVRRRLNRVMRHFKKLYGILGKRDELISNKADNQDCWQIDTDLLDPLSNSCSLEFDETQDLENNNNSKVLLSSSSRDALSTDPSNNIINDSYLKWSEYSRKHWSKTRVILPGTTGGDYCSESDSPEQLFDSFMTDLTDRIGPPSEDAIPMSLGPTYRLDRLSRNISSVSSLDSAAPKYILPQAPHLHPPVHKVRPRAGTSSNCHFGKSLKQQGTPSFAPGGSRSRALRRIAPD